MGKFPLLEIRKLTSLRLLHLLNHEKVAQNFSQKKISNKLNLKSFQRLLLLHFRLFSFRLLWISLNRSRLSQIFPILPYQEQELRTSSLPLPIPSPNLEIFPFYTLFRFKRFFSLIQTHSKKFFEIRNFCED